MAWVTRNKNKDYDTCGHDTFLTSHKPIRRRDGNFEKTKLGRVGDIYFKASDFKALFGFTPRKGTCRRYKRNLREQ